MKVLSATLAILAVPALLLATATKVKADSVRIEPGKVLVESFRGWGTSLCWWAHIIGGLPNREKFTDAIFRDLKLTIVRYNIGGGENPKYRDFPTDIRARIPGFSPERGKWDPNADQNQRRVLRDGLQRGVKNVDAFSNSPPWWMTESGSVTGGQDPNQDNLKPEFEQAFAEYLVAAMVEVERRDGVSFDTISAMNEPLSPWWKFGNRQEGCHMSPEQQTRVMEHVAQALAKRDMKMDLIAPETWSTANAIHAWGNFPEQIREQVRAIATHGYNTEARSELRAKAGDKPIWMSEHTDSDGSGMRMARAIIRDFGVMRVEEWVYWQVVERGGGWGLIENPLNGKSTDFRLTPKFYVLKQFTNWIPPGSQIVATDSDDFVAAIPPVPGVLVAVALNDRDSERSIEIEIAAASPSPAKVRQIRTSGNEEFVELPQTEMRDGKFAATLPPHSVTTFLIQRLEGPSDPASPAP